MVINILWSFMASCISDWEDLVTFVWCRAGLIRICWMAGTHLAELESSYLNSFILFFSSSWLYVPIETGWRFVGSRMRGTNLWTYKDSSLLTDGRRMTKRVKKHDNLTCWHGNTDLIWAMIIPLSTVDCVEEITITIEDGDRNAILGDYNLPGLRWATAVLYSRQFQFEFISFMLYCFGCHAFERLGTNQRFQELYKEFACLLTYLLTNRLGDNLISKKLAIH